MEVRDEEIVGESAYNEGMPETARLLEEMGVAVRSEGALTVTVPQPERARPKDLVEALAASLEAAKGKGHGRKHAEA